MSKTKSTAKVALSVYAVGFLFQCMQIGSNVVGDVAAQFPNLPITVIQMMVTMPPLLNFITTLLSGFLSLKVPKKVLITLGLIVALLGGVVFTVGNSSFWLILLSSALIGAGVGIFSTLVSAVTTENFDGQERAKVMGIQNGMGSIGGLIIGFITTAILTTGWRHLYYSYLLFVPVIIIVLVCMPMDHPVAEVAGQRQQKAHLRDFHPNGAYILNVIAIFLFFFGMITFLSNFAMYILGGGLGEAATCGLASNVMTIFCVIFSLSAAVLGKVLKRFHIVVGVFCGMLAMFIVYFTDGLAGMFVGISVLGIGLGCSMPAALLNVSRAVKPEVSGVAFSILWGASTIAQVISPYIVNPISVLIDGGTPNSKFLIGGIVLAVGFLYTLIYQLTHKELPDNGPAPNMPQ